LANYTITYNSAAFTITPKPASVTPDPASKVYGGADPAFTGTISGFLLADGVTATYSRTAGETVLGSPYTISATLAPVGVLSNYSITYNTANFTITAKPASVTPNAATKVYGSADPAFTGTISGFLLADGVTAMYSRASGETVLGGPYTISATLSPAAVLTNYSITYNTANFTITPAGLTITADYIVGTPAVDPFNKVYNGLVYTDFTVRYSGFVNGETPSVLGGTLSFSGAGTTAVLPGTYTVTPGGLTSTNYTITFANGTLNITYGTTCTGSDPGGVILPPINSDGTSVYKRKGGSTIPVKFKVCDANGNSISNPYAVFLNYPQGGQLTMTGQIRGTIDNVNESGDTVVPDVAFTFTGGQWHFNMDTGNLTAGQTYTFRINLAYGPGITFTVGIK
jgi:hypothetical protein